MATAIDKKTGSSRERLGHFAEKYIASRKDLYTMEGFPLDIWQGMAADELMGFGVSEKYGGLGGTYLTISMAAQTLAQRGRNMGLTLSWVIHQIAARYFIGTFGNESQQAAYLPELANGNITASIAISEPEAKAHPKYLKTSAVRKDDAYVINGEKSFLTNGSIADLYIVLAVTDTGDDNRKCFTSFIVPKDTKGLRITREITFDFLKPSPHCEIALTHCTVPASNILGEMGTAYLTMAKPLRDVEETCLMGLITGGMEAQIDLLIGLLQNQHIKPSNELMCDFGRLRYLLDTLTIVSHEAARMLDSGVTHGEFPSLLLSFRNLGLEFQSFLNSIITESGLEKNSEFGILTNDLIRAIDIARYVALIKQQKLGESLFIRKEVYNATG
jgi:alkylation response protein AidB-like acyl-CoA dehydrogenase